ncbi:MAG: hypoxanthine phosphoribosyltransferase, partial [Gammaproteobacteria bacterium]
MSIDEKVYISAQQLLEDSLELGRQILASDFRPNYIVGVWRGGTPVGIMVQELLDFYGVSTDHISIRTSSYSGLNRRKGSVRVHGLSYLTSKMNAEDSLLIVDDVFDTGLSVKAILDKLREKARKNLPHDVRVATAYFKPGKNRTDFLP